MITIPLYILLFIYIAYITLLGIFSFINLSHLFHNGAMTLVSFLMTILTAGLVATTLYITFTSLIGTDWQQAITLWNNEWLTKIFNPSNF